MEASSVNWYAIYTRYKAEFVVEKELRSKHFRVYLPTVRELRTWTDRTKCINLPIFPCYLFVNLRPTFLLLAQVANTRGVVSILGPSVKRPTPVPEEDVVNLQRLIESNQHLSVYPNIKEGSRVRVKKGPFSGIEGVLEKRGPKDQCRLFITIGPLGKSVAVNISAEALEIL